MLQRKLRVERKKFIITCATILLCLYLSSFQNALAYSAKFHELITEKAVKKSELSNYLNNNLGIDLEQPFRGPGWIYTSKPSTRNIIQWITYGSWKEDNPMGIRRAIRHFYNPTSPFHNYQRYLTDTGPFDPSTFNPDLISALEEARDNNIDSYSWEDAMNYYYQALTSTNQQGRDWNFAQTFRALGQVLHLLEDMGVPAHVRNDVHFIVTGEILIKSVLFK